MKKKIYSVVFALFGMLLALVIFGLFELAFMYVTGADQPPYVLGLGIIFLAAGAVGGALAAPFCWEMLYEGEDPLCKVPIYRRRARAESRKSIRTERAGQS